MYDFPSGMRVMCHSRVLSGMIVSEKRQCFAVAAFTWLKPSMVSSFPNTGVHSLMFKQAQAFLGGKEQGISM